MSEALVRARLLMGSGRYDLAEAELRRCLVEAPDDADAHAGLSHCLRERGELSEATAEAERAIRSAPDDPAGHFAHALALRERRHLDEAADAARQCIRLDPEDADWHALLADVRAGQGLWQESLEAAEMALSLDPEHLRGANLRSLALTHLNRPAEAAEAAAGMLEKAPEDADSHANRGWTLLHTGDSRRAQEHFAEALRLEPGHEWARDGLLRSLKARNRVYAAVLAWQLWMTRLRTSHGWIVLGVAMYLQHRLYVFAKSHPEQGWWTWPLHATIFVAFLATWLADPLGDLLLRFHSFGRRALSDDQRMASTLTAAGLALTISFSAEAWADGHRALFAWFALLWTAVLSTVYDCERGWPRRTMIALSAVDGALLVLAAGVIAYRWPLLLHAPKLFAYGFLGALYFLLYGIFLLGASLIAGILLQSVKVRR